MGHKDILDENFVQEEIRVIRDPKLVKIFYDESHAPIFWVLRAGPMTVKEIEIEYNKAVMREGKERGLNEKQLKELKLERSDKSIYRYIKELTKKGLVAPVGHRVVLGKTATEILYARTSKIFHLKTQEDDSWRCNICMKHLTKASQLLALSRDIKPPKPEELAEIMALIESDSETEVFRVLEDENEKVQQIFSDITFKDSDRILYVFRILYLAINAGKYEEKVRKLLEK